MLCRLWQPTTAHVVGIVAVSCLPSSRFRKLLRYFRVTWKSLYSIPLGLRAPAQVNAGHSRHPAVSACSSAQIHFATTSLAPEEGRVDQGQLNIVTPYF